MVSLADSYILYPLLAWTLLWKGMALWKSAKKNHLAWFIIFFLINTFGLLPIIYLLWLHKISTKPSEKQQKPSSKKPSKKTSAKKSKKSKK